MPPFTSSTDESDAESIGSEIPAKASVEAEKVNGKTTAKARVAANAGNTEDESEEEESEADEGVYDVETIETHTIKRNKILLKVKWLGYENEEDRTWEPEENLTESSKDLLADYYESIGGRPALPTNKKSAGKVEKPTTKERPAKRQKRGEEIGSKNLPKGQLWEADIAEIASLERTEDGQLRVQVKLKNGHHFAVTTSVAYKRFPQKMLAYYESKLSFQNA